ncbi:MAG: chorismate-binding protein, partial [Pseudomonadales bacterium]|nr:chorismate-binding protein [Pseudomonadales bacterium]
FPGGSITGAPKVRAMEIIEELEPQRRDAYCGSVLYQDFGGRMDSNLTIRSLYCEQDRIHCWAGGGIVADSDVTQEYAECFDKIQPLINTLSS